MIRLKSASDIAKLRLSGQVLMATFEHLKPQLQPGISTWELDRIANEFIRQQRAIPSFYQYNEFPGHICTSLNAEVIHGIPDKKRVLRAGDILTIDIGINLGGYFTDAARTYGIGRIAPADRKLIEVTEQSLRCAIETLAPKGVRVKDVGKAVTRFIKPYGYGIVDSYCGHGVGFEVHEDPQVYNCYPISGRNPRIRPGLVLAIEPMICQGSCEVELKDDDFTVVTADAKNSVHFEDTVAVLEDRVEILTRAASPIFYR